MDHQYRRALTSDGPAGNAALSSSAFHVPSSAAKKRSASRHGTHTTRPSMAMQSHLPNSRMSLAGGASMGLGPSRRSILATNRNGEATTSATRGDGGIYGRTPQMSRNLAPTRRSSVFGTGGRPSMAPAHLVNTKDSRPIRDRSFQQACRENVVSFMNERNVHGLTERWITSPIVRDFQIAFRFLATELVGPGLTWEKKFEDECLALLKDLRYPALETVSKTVLVAPGAAQAWPSVLAMLNWMVELCKAQQKWHDTEMISDPLLCSASELPLDHPQLEERLAWDFFSSAYKDWFITGESPEFSESDRQLGEAFGRIATSSADECQRLETAVNRKDTELRQLHAQEPPLKQIEEEHLQLMSDKTKFITWIDGHRQRVEKMKLAVVRTRDQVTDQSRTIQTARTELAETEAAVAAQNLSPDEVSRMTHEKESLSRASDELRGKRSEVSQNEYDQEMLVTKAMDRFEQLQQDYTTLSHQIGILSSHSGNMPPEFKDIDFAIDLDLGGENLNELRERGRAVMQPIRPALQQYSDKTRRQVHQLQNEGIALEDEHARIIQDVERQKEDVERHEMRLKLAHDQAEDAKKKLQEDSSEANRMVAGLESEVMAMRNASQQGVLSTQSQLEGTRIAFEELRHKTQQLQESIIHQMTGHVNNVLNLKDYTTTKLEGVKSLAEAQ